MERPKILVLCGGRFAFPAIQILGYEKYLCGVGIGKAEKSVSSFLGEEMEKNGIPFRPFETKADLAGLRNWIDTLQPDYIFSICFPFLVTDEVLSYGEERFFNFHTGPLPDYRGPMPIFEVLRYGEAETAISVHRMTADFDDGPVVLTERLPVLPGETFGSLANRLSERSAMVVQNMAQMLEYGSFVPSEEQDEAQARYFEFPEASDTTIQWGRMAAKEIADLVHACNPWNTGADAMLDGKPVKLLQAAIVDEPHTGFPGTVLGADGEKRMRIACLNGQQLAVEVISCDLGIVTAERYLQTLRVNKLVVN